MQSTESCLKARSLVNYQRTGMLEIEIALHNLNQKDPSNKTLVSFARRAHTIVS